jgi:hypothetical protein
MAKSCCKLQSLQGRHKREALAKVVVMPECLYRASSFIRQLESGFPLKTFAGMTGSGLLQEAHVITNKPSPLE